MIFTVQILLIFIAIQIASCSLIFPTLRNARVTDTVYKKKESKRNYLVIKTISNSPCDYTDVYAEKYENGRRVYQFSYGCSRFTTPGKTIYEYDVNGNVIKTIKYSFADSGDDTESLDKRDLLVMYLIDSIRSKQVVDFPECKICSKTITALKLLPELRTAK
jgi:hypothetical protein